MNHPNEALIALRSEYARGNSPLPSAVHPDYGGMPFVMIPESTHLNLMEYGCLDSRIPSPKED